MNKQKAPFESVTGGKKHMTMMLLTQREVEEALERGTPMQGHRWAPIDPKAGPRSAPRGKARMLRDYGDGTFLMELLVYEGEPLPRPITVIGTHDVLMAKPQTATAAA